MPIERARTPWLVVAMALYLGGALWALRVVLPAPTTILPRPPASSDYWGALAQGDQFFSVGRTTHVARLLRHDPRRLMDGLHCWPMPRAATLGEHMIGEGLLGVAADLAFREPILTYNSVLILMPVVAGLSMFALVFTVTRSTPAALVAGLLFALHPARLSNTAQPYWMGNHWTPLALAFAYRLFVHRRWRDALGLTAFTALQLLDSFYPVVAFALVGGTYVLSLAVRERRRLRALLPKLSTAAVVVVAVAFFVFAPYLRTRWTWPHLLAGRDTVLYAVTDLGLGGPLYPGTTMALLAIAGVIDRIRRRPDPATPDPRLPLLVGGVLALWSAVDGLQVLGLPIPSLLALAREWVPGVDAVRVGRAVSSGFHLACAVLAGFGARALLRRVPVSVAPVIVGILVVAALLEVFHPRVALATFGTSVTFEPLLARPTDEELALYARIPQGAVLDLPVDIYVPARYVFLSAYHGQPTVGCYGSYRSPLADEVIGIAKRLRLDASAAVKLSALGVRTVVSHQRRPLVPTAHIRKLAKVESVGLFTLERPSEIEAGLRPLMAGDEDPPVDAPAGAESVRVRFRNGARALYRHPDPIEPTALEATWLDGRGAVVARHEVRLLLPLVLIPGEVAIRDLRVPVPSVAGDYRLVLTTSARRELLKRTMVRVRLPAPNR